jgi:DNA-binding protein YbaB
VVGSKGHGQHTDHQAQGTQQEIEELQEEKETFLVTGNSGGAFAKLI